MSVTIKDVATAAGVSTATVSHVFNETRFVSEGTKRRVQQMAARLGYVPNVNAAGLRGRRTKRIGLLVPAVSSFFSVDILDAVEPALLARGYQLMFGCTHEDIVREREQIEIFNYQRIDGLLMFPAPGDHSYLDQMPRQYPIVFLDREATGCRRDVVLGENYQATYDVISQMIREGHRCIGIVNGTEGVSCLQERIDGYKQALADHGIPFEPAFLQNGNSSFQGGYDATDRLIHDGRVTAIVALSPAMVVGCFRCLIKHSIRIPEQIALLSFGNSAWAGVTNPPLSVMRHPLLEIGQVAAQKLLERLDACGGRAYTPPETYETIRLPIELVRRCTY